MAKCRRGFASNDGKTSERLPPHVPLDLLLEILARSDVETVVRCTATSKAIRRVILGQDFRRRLALRTEANGGFDPALLLGVSYRLRTDAVDYHVAQTSRQHLRFDARLLLSFDAVASRDGLVVLQQRQTGRRSNEVVPTPELSVDSLTGETCLLPPAAIRHDYPLALLSVGDAAGGRYFQLLAVDRDLRTQTFSSTDGKWGPVRQTCYASQLPYLAPGLSDDYTSRPIVLGSSTVQWLRLHRTPAFHERRYCKDPHIVALDVRSAQATRIDLPPECISRMRCIQDTRVGLLLAALPDGRPAVLTAEILVISMWTLSETEHSSPALKPTWIRQVVIKRQVIGMETGMGFLRFLGFGQRSGTVLLQMDAADLVQLNLGSKAEVLTLRRDT
ncbi:hypothetical protein EJB05_04224, partial [Eragrostis curvula]